MTPHDELLVHSRPVNKTAALHIAGGDRLGREELLWAQREAFERAVVDARLRNMEEAQRRRREFAKDGGMAHNGKKYVNGLRSLAGLADKREKLLRTIRPVGIKAAKLGHQRMVWIHGRDVARQMLAQRRAATTEAVHG